MAGATTFSPMGIFRLGWGTLKGERGRRRPRAPRWSLLDGAVQSVGRSAARDQPSQRKLFEKF